MYIYHKINFTSGKIKIIHKMILRDFKMSGMGFAYFEVKNSENKNYENSSKNKKCYFEAGNRQK